MLLASFILAEIAVFGVDYISLGFGSIESLRGSINPVGNIVFVIALFGFVIRGHDIRLFSIASSIAVCGSTIVIAFLAFLGLIVSQFWFAGSLVLMGIVGAVGYYPAGADVPFESGILMWFLSTILLIVSSFLLISIFTMITRHSYRQSN
jgi:hypothetical protein